MTNAQANRERRCLVCGTPGATLYRLCDGRNWRCCERCAITSEAAEQLNSATERGPLPSEITDTSPNATYEGAV